MAITLISSIGELEAMADRWDSFVIDQSTNPFFLSGYVRYFMIRCRMEGWTPALIVKTSGSGLEGIAAFKTKRTLGVNTAEFLLPLVYSPDFLEGPQDHLSFPMESLDFLFDELGCQLAELVLPSSSSHVRLLDRWSAARGISFHKLPPRKLLTHSVLPVLSTWSDFARARGGDFARHYAKIERKLREKGRPTTESVTIDCPEVVARILELDRKSWKEEYRRKRGMPTDPDLELLFRYSNSCSPKGLQFCPQVWFLELDGEPIAYAIVVRFKETAFIVKTSYDSSFSKFYPGDYVQNTVVRDLFDSKRFSIIDFHTKLSYHRRWTNQFLVRERVRLCRTGILSAFLAVFDWNQTASRLTKTLLSRAKVIDIA